MLGHIVGGKRMRNDNTSYGLSPPGSQIEYDATSHMYVMCVPYMCGVSGFLCAGVYRYKDATGPTVLCVFVNDGFQSSCAYDSQQWKTLCLIAIKV